MDRHCSAAIAIAVFAAVASWLSYLAAASHSQLVWKAPDSNSYEKPALALLAGYGFREEPEPGAQPATKRTPGYPAFISAVYWFCGRRPEAVILLQCVIRGVAVFLTFLIGREVFGPGAGLFAAVVMGADPVGLVLSHNMLTETLGTFLLCCATYVLVRTLMRRPAHDVDALHAGALYSLAAITRPIGYYLPLLLLGEASVWAIKRKRFAVRFLVSGALPFVLIFGGWQIRNLVATGSASFSTITGVNMLDYRAASIWAEQHGISRQNAAKWLESEVAKESAPAGDVNDQRIGLATTIIAKYPATYLKQVILGAFTVCFGPGFHTVMDPFGRSFKDPMGRIIGGYALIFLLSCYGLALCGCRSAIKTGFSAGHFILIQTAAYFVALSAGSEAECRFRVPFMFCVAVFAGAGVDWIVEFVGIQYSRQKAHRISGQAAWTSR